MTKEFNIHPGRGFKGLNYCGRQYEAVLNQGGRMKWDEFSVHNLERARNQGGEQHEEAVSLAFRDALKGLTSDSRIADWGIGSGPFYPRLLPVGIKPRLVALYSFFY